jgi:MFS family permease
MTKPSVLDQVPDGTPFILLAFIVRIFEGVGAAAFLTSSYTICSGEFPTRVATIFVSVFVILAPLNRESLNYLRCWSHDRWQALLETCFGLGLILGPTVGGALYQASGYYLPFVVLGSFLVLGGVIAFWSLPKNGVFLQLMTLWHVCLWFCNLFHDWLLLLTSVYFLSDSCFFVYCITFFFSWNRRHCCTTIRRTLGFSHG